MSLTSKEVKHTFQRLCEEYGKLFIPDDKRDPGIVSSLINHYENSYDTDLLIQCIDFWIRKADEPILIYNFAIESSTVRERVLSEREIQKNFDELLAQTKKRMENLGK